jgi:hypothetical protein
MGLTGKELQYLTKNMTAHELEAFLINYCKKQRVSKNYINKFLYHDGSLAINRITIGIVTRDMEFHMAKNKKARARGERLQSFPITMGNYIRFINGLLTLEHLS